jgi:hypothetical protein
MEAGGIFCLVSQNVFLDVKRVIRHRKCGREKIIGGLAQEQSNRFTRGGSWVRNLHPLPVFVVAVKLRPPMRMY